VHSEMQKHQSEKQPDENDPKTHGTFNREDGLSRRA
jgi:hypothetical protein